MVKNQNQPKRDAGWLNQLRHSHTMEYPAAVKKNGAELEC